MGWLDAGHGFPTGTLNAELLERIRVYAERLAASVTALRWGVLAGPHTCTLCGSHRASGNFGVPADDLLVVCPEMISHYVTVHAYLPPAEFLSAIRRAPLPGTAEYSAVVERFVATDAP